MYGFGLETPFYSYFIMTLTSEIGTFKGKKIFLYNFYVVDIELFS